MRIVLFFSILFFSSVQGQNHTVDSLKQEFSKTDNPKEQVKIYRHIGFVFLNAQVYFDSAFYYAKKGHKIAAENDLVLEQAQTLFDQGFIYASIKEWDKALLYYEKSGEFSKKGDIKRGMSAAYNNIGTIYVEQEKYELAKKYYETALTIAKEIDDKKAIAVAHLNFGEISFFENDFENSKKQIELSQQIFATLGYTPPSAYTFLAKTYFATGDFETAEIQALKGFKLSETEGDLKYSYDNALTLSKIYTERKEFEKANSFTHIAMVYNDSILSSKKLNEVEKSELRFALNEQEEVLTRLEEKNKYLTTIYALGAFGVLLLIILVFRQLKITRMTKNIHDIQNRLIKSELDIRDNKQTSTFDATVAGDNEDSEEII